MAKKGGLGKGLGESALIVNTDFENEQKVVSLKITEVEPNADQPRKTFDAEKLEALADSISQHGVIQPILVSKLDDRYRIVAGERRWRAAKIANLKEIPAIVCDYDEVKVAEVALIENLQREDLNPVEEAKGYKSLLDKFGLTQEKISERVGKSRSAVANSLRLLSLGEDVLKCLENGDISTGHAKVILSVPKEMQEKVLKAVLENNLTVRETESYIKRLNQPSRPRPVLDDETRIHIKALEDETSSNIGTRVQIKHKNGKGKIEIDYYSNDDLDRILQILNNC